MAMEVIKLVTILSRINLTDKPVRGLEGQFEPLKEPSLRIVSRPSHTLKTKLNLLFDTFARDVISI